MVDISNFNKIIMFTAAVICVLCVYIYLHYVENRELNLMRTYNIGIQLDYCYFAIVMKIRNTRCIHVLNISNNVSSIICEHTHCDCILYRET